MPTAFSAAPDKKPESPLDDGVLRALAYGAATLLLFHELVCRCRPCRRAHGCLMRSRGGRPDCLGAAPPDALALHAALFAETARLLETLAFAPSTPVAPLSRDPDDRELQEAAVEILHALLPRQGVLRDRFSARRRAQETLSGPPYAGDDLTEYRDFLRHIRARPIAPQLAGGVPATLPRPPGKPGTADPSPHSGPVGGCTLWPHALGTGTGCARPPLASGKGGGSAGLPGSFGKIVVTARRLHPSGKGGGDTAYLPHACQKGGGTVCLPRPPEPAAPIRHLRPPGGPLVPAAPYSAAAVRYSAAALAADASSTAAKAASITSGPAPGRVASADRIWR